LSDLTKITTELGEAYKAWKDGEKDKDELRKQFFTAIDERLAQEKPAEKYVTIGHRGMAEEDARERLTKKYPTWKVDELRPSGDGWEAILVELSAYAAFTFVNAADGKVYQRQVSAGSVYIDDERLLEEDPDLWFKVTEVPNRGTLADLLYECGVDHLEVDNKIDYLWPESQRVLRPLDSLDADTLAALSEYIYEGKPTVKLAAPRKAKAEELE
jgi:hypothetical protein